VEKSKGSPGREYDNLNRVRCQRETHIQTETYRERQTERKRERAEVSGDVMTTLEHYHGELWRPRGASGLEFQLDCDNDKQLFTSGKFANTRSSGICICSF